MSLKIVFGSAITLMHLLVSTGITFGDEQRVLLDKVASDNNQRIVLTHDEMPPVSEAYKRQRRAEAGPGVTLDFPKSATVYRAFVVAPDRLVDVAEIWKLEDFLYEGDYPSLQFQLIDVNTTSHNFVIVYRLRESMYVYGADLRAGSGNAVATTQPAVTVPFAATKLLEPWEASGNDLGDAAIATGADGEILINLLKGHEIVGQYHSQPSQPGQPLEWKVNYLPGSILKNRAARERRQETQTTTKPSTSHLGP